MFPDHEDEHATLVCLITLTNEVTLVRVQTTVTKDGPTSSVGQSKFLLNQGSWFCVLNCKALCPDLINIEGARTSSEVVRPKRTTLR